MTTEPTDTAANIERLHGTALAVMELEESAAAASGRFDRLADLCLTRLQTEEISPGVVVDVESEDNDSLGRGDIRLFKWLCRAAILPAVVAQGGRQDAATPADEATAAAIERLLNFSDRCAGMPSKSCAEAKPLIAQITAQEPVDPIPRQLKKMVVARTAMPAPSR